MRSAPPKLPDPAGDGEPVLHNEPGGEGASDPLLSPRWGSQGAHALPYYVGP